MRVKQESASFRVIRGPMQLAAQIFAPRKKIER
jgi:hypothetical protein